MQSNFKSNAIKCASLACAYLTNFMDLEVNDHASLQ